MQKGSKTRRQRPKQKQDRQPGVEGKMRPPPVKEDSRYVGSNKLHDKIALITGGDSGIGSAAAIAFAKEGAHVAIVYHREHADARETKRIIENSRRECLLLPGDISRERFCRQCVERTVRRFGKLDILVNNAAVQFPQEGLEKISARQLERTFQVNLFAMFYLVKAALKYLRKGSVIINTTSVTAYRGSPQLIDYSSSKGAIVSFTRSLSASLAKKKIRVNAVAPGPIWTPLIPASFGPEKTAAFGSDVPLGRAGQPEEVAPCFVFLAADDSSYMTGQVLHPNGGEIING